MGSIRDWSKVFDGVDYLEFDCVMSFLPEMRIEEEERADVGHRLKNYELIENEKREYESERSFRTILEEISFAQKKSTENLYGKRSAEEAWYKREKERELFEKGFEEDLFEEITLFEKLFPRHGENEEGYKIPQFLPDERDVYERGEKILSFYGERKEEMKALSGAKRSEVIKSINEQKSDTSKMQIEMKEVKRREYDVDMDLIEEMLTSRLCDMMQKSVEGYYI